VWLTHVACKHNVQAVHIYTTPTVTGVLNDLLNKGDFD
jgi:hypothetical protein